MGGGVDVVVAVGMGVGGGVKVVVAVAVGTRRTTALPGSTEVRAGNRAQLIRSSPAIVTLHK